MLRGPFEAVMLILLLLACRMILVIVFLAVDVLGMPIAIGVFLWRHRERVV